MSAGAKWILSFPSLAVDTGDTPAAFGACQVAIRYFLWRFGRMIEESQSAAFGESYMGAGCTQQYSDPRAAVAGAGNEYDKRLVRMGISAAVSGFGFGFGDVFDAHCTDVGR